MNRQVVRLSIESLKELWIWPELLCAALKLAGVTNEDAEPAMKRAQDAAHLNFAVAELAQVTHLIAVFAEAHEDEAAVVIGGFGGADIEKSGAVGEFNDLIDVGTDAGVVIGLRRNCQLRA